jgi:FkbM family methyltransferase
LNIKSIVKDVLRPAKRAPVRPGPYFIATNSLGVYCVPKQAIHRPACQSILRGEVWESETIDFLCDNARDSIVHAGTFFGDFVPALARAYSHVWAFEPNRDSFKCAEVTILLNDIGNVTIANAALGKADGKLSLCTERQGKYLGGGSFVIETPGKTPVRALDAVIPSDCRVGAIQLDVEGYEGPALHGARKTIERCRPLIVVENIPRDNILKELGYSEQRVINGNHVFKKL